MTRRQLKGKTVCVQRATTTDRYATEVFEPKGNPSSATAITKIYMDLASGGWMRSLPTHSVERLPAYAPGKATSFVGGTQDPKYVGEGAGMRCAMAMARCWASERGH